MDILALDLGTSSARALVLDDRAVPRPGALARRKTKVTVDAAGAGTLDAPAYLADVVECLDELHAAGRLDDVGLVAVSAQWHSVLPLDRSGVPLGPVLTWLDTRPVRPDDAPQPADEADFHRRTGTWVHRCYWTVRLPWLRRQLADAPVRYTGLVEYVLGELLGPVPMSVSQASGTGLLDLCTLDWDPEALAVAGARVGELPTLAPTDWRGRLVTPYARRWPALARAEWAPPVGDGAASNVGSGCVDPSRAAVTVGTSAAVRLVQRAPAGQPVPSPPSQLWRYRVDHGHVVTGAAYSSGGNLFAWAHQQLRLPEGPQLAEALAKVPVDGRVHADFRFGGDRPPGIAPTGSGSLHGLGFDTTAVEILAALMVSVSHQMAEDLGEIERIAGQSVEVVLGGGAVAASVWWRQALAAVLAPRPVRYQPNPEIGAVGAALVALGQVDTATRSGAIGRMDDVPLPTSVDRAHPQRRS